MVHSIQAVWSVVCLNPSKQTHPTIFPLPATDSALDGHAKHTDSDVAATEVEYVWFAHMVQGLEPKLPLKAPDGHVLQGPPSGPV